MGTPTSMPDWRALGRLYDQLAVIERYRPGSDQARDVEDAITILLDGRTSSSEPRHRHHDAVRRARFLRLQAARKQPAALSRAILPKAYAPPFPADREERDDRLAEPADEVTPEDVACARETVRELSRPVGRAHGQHAAAVLDGLLEDCAPARIATDIGISRSTVDRCIVQLRLDVHRLLASAAAA